MRTRISIAGVAIGAMLLTACGDDDTDDDRTAQERIAELEAELEEAREDAAELLADNERLHEEIRQLTDEPPNEEPTDDEEPTDEEPTDDDSDGSCRATADPQPGRAERAAAHAVRPGRGTGR